MEMGHPRVGGRLGDGVCLLAVNGVRLCPATKLSARMGHPHLDCGDDFES